MSTIEAIIDFATALNVAALLGSIVALYWLERTRKKWLANLMQLDGQISIGLQQLEDGQRIGRLKAAVWLVGNMDTEEDRARWWVLFGELWREVSSDPKMPQYVEAVQWKTARAEQEGV
jgi:hypothetical protein